MPRPIKLGFDYFSLDTDFFQNKTINALRRTHDSIGVLVYLNLLCRIYREGYYIKFDSLDDLALDIAEEIASTQIRRVASQVAETINYLVGRGTLSEALFKRGIISGEKIQEQYVLSAYKAKRNIKLGVHGLVDVNLVIRKFKVNSEKTTVNSEEMAVNSELSTQSNSNSNTHSNNTTTTTTTTIISLTSARARACENTDDAMDGPPNNMDVAAIFENEYGMGKGESIVEALRFWEYNQARGWDCLPHWRVAVVRWVEQKIYKER